MGGKSPPPGHESVGRVALGKGYVIHVLRVGDLSRRVSVSESKRSTARGLKLPLGMVVYAHKPNAGGWYACEIDREGDAVLYRVYVVDRRDETEGVHQQIGKAFATSYERANPGKKHKTRGATVARDFGLCGSHLKIWIENQT